VVGRRARVPVGTRARDCGEQVTGRHLPAVTDHAADDGLPAQQRTGRRHGSAYGVPRSEVAETLASRFLQAARSKGQTTSRLLAVHALRPSLIPVVAFIAADVGQLVVGLIIVGGVFDLPGTGGAIFQSIRDRDRSLLVGLVTVVMVLVLIANAIADILTVLIDPRLRPGPPPADAVERGRRRRGPCPLVSRAVSVPGW